ncbi:Glycine cleavage system H protein [compost metagenome]
MVFVELPEPGAYSVGQEVATLESVKAASNITMPLDGEVVEVNADLQGSPELVNEDAMSAGWFFRMRPNDAAQLAELLDREAYDRLIQANA